jgi:hypothetical protein
VHRARAPCDPDRLQAELLFLRDVFRQNDYNDRQIHRVLSRLPNISQPDDNPDLVTFLYSTESAEFCPGITSNQWACFPRKYLVSSGWSKITWDLGYRVCRESPLSVARITLGRQAVRWKRG